VSPSGEPVPAVKPGGAEPHVPAGEPARPGRARLRGAVKFAGPIVLDMVTAYFINKHEQQVIAKAISAKIASPEVKNRIVEEVEKERLNIAYKQMRGHTVYATVDLRMRLVNELMNSEVMFEHLRLTDNDQSESMSTVMSHGSIVGDEEKTRWDTVSMPIPRLEVSESERLRLNLRALDEAGAQAPPDATSRRAQLVADIARAERAEAAEREAEISRPRVLPDAKQREKQQAELTERLRKKPTNQPPTAAPQPPSAGSTQLLTPPGSPPAAAGPMPAQTDDQAGGAFLPGAPGEDPVARAATYVNTARRITLALHADGMALENRLPSTNSPTDAERRAWVGREGEWRALMKWLMNEFHKQSRDEAVRDVGQLLDEYGPKLAQIHTHLVG
jgi:hypothetical protein